MTPKVIAFPVNDTPWREVDLLALSHAVDTGTAVVTPDLAADIEAAEAEHAQAIGEVYDLLLSFCAERGIPFDTTPDHDRVYRGDDGSLALATATPKKENPVTYRPELGYDPAEYATEPVRDDGLVSVADPAWSADNARLAIEEGHLRARGGSGGFDSHPDFERRSAGATPPVLTRHGDGSAIIGTDGQPLWGGSHDSNPPVHYRSADIEFTVSHPSRDDLAAAALRSLGMRP